VEALKKIPREQAIEVLQQDFEDEHPYVQQAAQDALTLLHRIRQ
jgi:HEAT repeat protein